MRSRGKKARERKMRKGHAESFGWAEFSPLRSLDTFSTVPECSSKKTLSRYQLLAPRTKKSATTKEQKTHCLSAAPAPLSPQTNPSTWLLLLPSPRLWPRRRSRRASELVLLQRRYSRHCCCLRLEGRREGGAKGDDDGEQLAAHERALWRRRHRRSSCCSRSWSRGRWRRFLPRRGTA